MQSKQWGCLSSRAVVESKKASVGGKLYTDGHSQSLPHHASQVSGLGGESEKQRTAGLENFSCTQDPVVEKCTPEEVGRPKEL